MDLFDLFPLQDGFIGTGKQAIIRMTQCMHVK